MSHTRAQYIALYYISVHCIVVHEIRLDKTRGWCGGEAQRLRLYCRGLGTAMLYSLVQRPRRLCTDEAASYLYTSILVILVVVGQPEEAGS